MRPYMIKTAVRCLVCHTECLADFLVRVFQYTHTHTHIYIYIYHYRDDWRISSDECAHHMRIQINDYSIHHMGVCFPQNLICNCFSLGLHNVLASFENVYFTFVEKRLNNFGAELSYVKSYVYLWSGYFLISQLYKTLNDIQHGFLMAYAHIQFCCKLFI